MERLTQKALDSEMVWFKDKERLFEPCEMSAHQSRMAIAKLAAYEQSEEMGLLLRLPCKAGTEVYNINWWDDVQEKVVVKGKTYYRTVHKHKVTKSTFSYFDVDKFGKTIFLTREEAEAKLKEMEGAE